MILAPSLITPAATRPVTIEAARKACRVDTTDDDDEIEGYIDVAVSWLQPPTGWLGRSLLECTLRLDLPGWPRCVMELPAGPVRAIEHIKYFDDDNAEQTLSSGAYLLDGDALVWTDAFAEPSLYSRPGAVRITYNAGYANADALPAALKQGVLLLVAHLYEHRGDVSEDLPAAVQALLMPFKRWA